MKLAGQSNEETEVEDLNHLAEDGKSGDGRNAGKARRLGDLVSTANIESGIYPA